MLLNGEQPQTVRYLTQTTAPLQQVDMQDKCPQFSKEFSQSSLTVMNKQTGLIHPAQVQLQARIDGGFFLHDGVWTCYRRNYFYIDTGVRIVSQAVNTNVMDVHFKDERDLSLNDHWVFQVPNLQTGEMERVVSLRVRLSADTNKEFENGRKPELVAKPAG